MSEQTPKSSDDLAAIRARRAACYDSESLLTELHDIDTLLAAVDQQAVQLAESTGAINGNATAAVIIAEDRARIAKRAEAAEATIQQKDEQIRSACDILRKLEYRLERRWAANNESLVTLYDDLTSVRQARAALAASADAQET